ncbi:sialin-like [Antedon mediterranea]|uniref:sialin-like n=1 Tax=Antedon mediterranea TaxID=105859 RepID=UPI003AF6A887
MVRRENLTEYHNLTDNLTYGIDERKTGIPRYDWDERQKQTVLAAFYYGNAVTPIPGAWLARKISGKRSMVGVLLCSGLLTALIPWAAGFNYYLLLFIRVLDGCVQGVSYPAMYELLENWIIPQERSKLMSIVFSGMLSVFVAIIWMVFIYEKPDKDPYISNAEREYINSFETSEQNTPIEWVKVLTSSAVWVAVIIGRVGHVVIGRMSPGRGWSCVDLVGVVVGIALVVADWIRALAIPSLCLICIGFFKDSPAASVVFLALAFIFLGIYTSSVMPSIMEISKGHSGVIAGIVTSLASPACFIGPMMLGAFTVDNNTFKQWSLMFNITAGTTLVGMSSFLLFGRSEEQTSSEDEKLTKHEMSTYRTIE